MYKQLCLMLIIYKKKKNLPSNELCDPDATFKITISKVVHAIQCYIIFKFRNLEIL